MFEGKSVTQEDHPADDGAAPPPSRPSYTPNRMPMPGRMLMRYQAIAAPAQPAQQARAPVSPHKFEGKSVTQEESCLRSGACAAAESAELHTEPTCVRCQDDHARRVPAHCAACRRAGARPRAHRRAVPYDDSQGCCAPTRATAIVTTTHDYQTETVIKVVAMVDDKPVVLGSFELGGIPPLLLGVPQVHVTYDRHVARSARLGGQPGDVFSRRAHNPAGVKGDPTCASQLAR